jgi:hypothetical protein
MATASNLEELFVTPEYRLVRTGRFLITELLTVHRVLSTSARSWRSGDDGDGSKYELCGGSSESG